MRQRVAKARHDDARCTNVASSRSIVPHLNARKMMQRVAKGMHDAATCTNVASSRCIVPHRNARKMMQRVAKADRMRQRAAKERQHGALCIMTLQHAL